MSEQRRRPVSAWISTADMAPGVMVEKIAPCPMGGDHAPFPGGRFPHACCKCGRSVFPDPINQNPEVS